VRDRGYSWRSNGLANKSGLGVCGIGRGMGRYAGDYGRPASTYVWGFSNSHVRSLTSFSLKLAEQAEGNRLQKSAR
jgi:hypothetical protein